jgi:GTP cyclohydrolase II
MTVGTSAARVRRTVRIPIRLQDGAYRRAHIVTFHGLCDRREHLAILMSGWRRAAAPLVRLHSECLTGDVFASGRCDCGPQLDEALTRCDQEGGVILYLRQEGRGIGLYNKIDAYALQDGGLDTFEANQALDFKHDLRDYRPAAQMLGALRLRVIRLITNNPDKVHQLRALDIKIAEQVPTGVYPTSDNLRYLHAKRDKAGHLIDPAATPPTPTDAPRPSGVVPVLPNP